MPEPFYPVPLIWPIQDDSHFRFVFLSGNSKDGYDDTILVFMSLSLSPYKLDANWIDCFLVIASYLCDNLTSELCYRNALKEFFTGEQVKGLFTVASTLQAQSSLFFIVSAVCPNGVDVLIEQCMEVVTDYVGFPVDVDNQSKMRSVHKLLLSLGGFDAMFEALTQMRKDHGIVGIIVTP